MQDLLDGKGEEWKWRQEISRSVKHTEGRVLGQLNEEAALRVGKGGSFVQQIEW